MNVFEKSNYHIHLEKRCNDLDYISIPDAILRYHRETLFFSWQNLELQLARIDPEKDPDIYQALDERACVLFSAWIQFRYLEGRGA